MSTFRELLDSVTGKREQHDEHAAERSASIWGEIGGANHRPVQRPAAHGQEANDVLLTLVKQNVNKPMGATPEWAPQDMRNPDPRVQCASTASNLYRQAMKYAHVLHPSDETSYQNLEQVLVSKWVATMLGAKLAVEIPRSQIKPGDAVVGEYDRDIRHGRNDDRHIGFIGDYDARQNRWSAYSNSHGLLRLQDLEQRFGHYREQHFYRLYFPGR